LRPRNDTPTHNSTTALRIVPLHLSPRTLAKRMLAGKFGACCCDPIRLNRFAQKVRAAKATQLSTKVVDKFVDCR
jgi:hypothetical protein